MVGRALVFLLLALLAATAAPAAAADLVLDAQSGFIVPVEIKGVTLRLRVDPAASGLVILNPEAAQRARLTPEIRPPNSFLPGAYPRESYARIGPVSLVGRTRLAPARIAGAPGELRFIWFDREAVDGADGIISLAGLPFEHVTLRLAAPRAGEAETSLRLEFSPEMGLYFPYPLGARAIPIQFSVWRRDNMSTAAAGAILADGLGGAWRGDYGRRTVNFGIDRPVRPMGLARPIDLGGLRVGQFLVRTGDYRGGYVLPSDTADPDEIVVTGAAQRQTARLNLILGRDQLAGCSALLFEAATRRLTLHCAPDPSPPVSPRSLAAPSAQPGPPAGLTPAARAVRIRPRSGW